MPQVDLVISGLGVSASLGVGAVHIGAAVRAGISGARELTFSVTSAVDADEETVVGHAVPELTEGFSRDARLARLVQLAVSDLVRADGDRPEADRLVVVAPTREWLRREHPRDAGPLEGEDVAFPPPRWDDARLLAALTQRARLPVMPSEVIREGPAGLMTALIRAAQAGGTTLVVAVDSLVDPEVLPVLHVGQRLRCSGQPMGLQPGEAAVVMRVGLPGGAPGGCIRGHIAAVGQSTDVRSYVSGDPPTGTGIAEALGRLGGAVPAGPPPLTYVDLNGEIYRATDWGNALVHAETAPWVREAEMRYPAASLGDTGCASAALNAAMAAHELAHTHRADRAAVVVSASDTGERGALLLTAASV